MVQAYRPPVCPQPRAARGEMPYPVGLIPWEKGWQMAKPNYAFAKRQRDLAKKQKKEEKRQRKTGTTDEAPREAPPQLPGDEKPAG